MQAKTFMTMCATLAAAGTVIAGCASSDNPAASSTENAVTSSASSTPTSTQSATSSTASSSTTTTTASSTAAPTPQSIYTADLVEIPAVLPPSGAVTDTAQVTAIMDAVFPEVDTTTLLAGTEPGCVLDLSATIVSTSCATTNTTPLEERLGVALNPRYTFDVAVAPGTLEEIAADCGSDGFTAQEYPATRGNVHAYVLTRCDDPQADARIILTDPSTPIPGDANSTLQYVVSGVGNKDAIEPLLHELGFTRTQ